MCKLNSEQANLYKTVYCSLCKSLKKNYGVSASYLLNYDITFLALLKLRSDGEKAETYEKYCAYKCKKCQLLSAQEDALFECSSVLIILAYEKILDNIRDEHFLKKTAALFLKLIYRRKYLKAKKAFPELAEEIGKNMLLQQSYEDENKSIDVLAHPTADSLGKIFSYGSQNSAGYYSLGYYLGRWVYFIDAADDREKDKKSKSFNPYFGRDYSNEKIDELLNFSAAEAVESYKKLGVSMYHAIIQNILYDGTQSAQKRVLEGENSGSVYSFRNTVRRRAAGNKQSV